MIKELDYVDVESLLQEYRKLEESIQWTDMGHKGKQAGVQFKPGDDPWASAVGKMKDAEDLYTELNPFFESTLIQEVIKKYGLLRTRLMWVGPYACYSMHRDTAPRIHLPLITNTDCYFVFKNHKPVHMRAGVSWYVDTRSAHTFMNCSDRPRLHLVGVKML